MGSETFFQTINLSAHMGALKKKGYIYIYIYISDPFSIKIWDLQIRPISSNKKLGSSLSLKFRFTQT